MSTLLLNPVHKYEHPSGHVRHEVNTVTGEGWQEVRLDFFDPEVIGAAADALAEQGFEAFEDDDSYITDDDFVRFVTLRRLVREAGFIKARILTLITLASGAPAALLPLVA